MLSSILSSSNLHVYFDIELGSINTVFPLDDVSIIFPGILFLYDDFIGIVYLPFLWLIKNSWIHSLFEGFLKNLSNFSLIFPSHISICLLIFFNSLLALESTLFPLIHILISSTIKFNSDKFLPYA